MSFSRPLIYFGSRKEIPFVPVEHNCPTMRSALFWREITTTELRYICEHKNVQKVLVAAQKTPYNLAIVHSTYPKLDITFRLIERELFEQFWFNRTPADFYKVDWRREGF